MALNVQKGTITAPASTGNQTLSLPANFDPKVIALWTTGQTTDARADGDGRFSLGWGTYRGATPQRFYTSEFATDNLATTNNSRGNGVAAILKLQATATTNALNVDLVSMSTGATSNVILNFVATLSGAVIHYWVLGGSDITDAQAGKFTQGTAVATQDVTVASGFGQPDLLVFQTNCKTSETDNVSFTVPHSSLGFAKSATERWFACFNDSSSAAITLCAAMQRQKALLTVGATVTAIDSEADLSAKASWPVDGFQLSYSDQAAVANIVYYVALKGTFAATIGDTTIPTAVAPQTQNLTLAGGATPAGAIFCGWPGPTQAAGVIDTADADNGGWTVGATDGTNEGCAGWTEDDANTTSCTGVSHSTTKVFQGVTADSTVTNPPILNSEADSSISGSDVVLTWGDTDTVARAFGYLLLGSGLVPAMTRPFNAIPFM